MSKLIKLEDAIGRYVDSGHLLCFSGNALHRAPMAAVREIARQKKSRLKIAKTAGALEIDFLCAMNLVEEVDAGFVSYESFYGLCSHYRKAVEEQRVKGNEHSCYTVICALRGAVTNVPFMPVHGMINSDLLAGKDYFKVVEDPFGSGEVVTLVQTLRPDTAILHVDKADEEGNAMIKGAMYDDEIILKAAKHVVVTAEKVVPSLVNNFEKQQITIPGFLVDAVVQVERGAQPCSCEGRYDVDDRMLKKFLAGTELKDHEDWIDSYEKADRTSRPLTGRAVR